jgi:hypothetical protein
MVEFAQGCFVSNPYGVVTVPANQEFILQLCLLTRTSYYDSRLTNVALISQFVLAATVIRHCLVSDVDPSSGSCLARSRWQANLCSSLD